MESQDLRYRVVWGGGLDSLRGFEGSFNIRYKSRDRGSSLEVTLVYDIIYLIMQINKR